MSGAAAPRRRGPRPGDPDTRSQILAAAHEEFAEVGYDAATVRSIAARVGVNAAMINHYFGGKEALFREVTRIPVDPAVTMAKALDGPRSGLGLRVALAVLGIWDDPQRRGQMMAIVRSALADPARAQLVQQYLRARALPVLAAAARGPRPERGAALAMAHLFGAAMGRYLLELPELAEPTLEEFAGELGPAVQRYLDGTISTSVEQGV